MRFDSRLIHVPSVAVGRIIGKGGRVPGAIRQDTGCSVKVQNATEPAMLREIRLTGTTTSIEDAERAIWEKVAETAFDLDPDTGDWRCEERFDVATSRFVQMPYAPPAQPELIRPGHMHSQPPPSMPQQLVQTPPHRGHNRTPQSSIGPPTQLPPLLPGRSLAVSQAYRPPFAEHVPRSVEIRPMINRNPPLNTHRQAPLVQRSIPPLHGETALQYLGRHAETRAEARARDVERELFWAEFCAEWSSRISNVSLQRATQTGQIQGLPEHEIPPSRKVIKTEFMEIPTGDSSEVEWAPGHDERSDIEVPLSSVHAASTDTRRGIKRGSEVLDEDEGKTSRRPIAEEVEKWINLQWEIYQARKLARDEV